MVKPYPPVDFHPRIRNEKRSHQMETWFHRTEVTQFYPFRKRVRDEKEQKNHDIICYLSTTSKRTPTGVPKSSRQNLAQKNQKRNSSRHLCVLFVISFKNANQWKRPRDQKESQSYMF